MGANAQTSVPAFSVGQVLTAQQQTEINTGIPVFATTTTRDAAFGGTGEKTLAEGQFAYIEATNTTQYYDGAAWQTVGASGLVCVKAETAFTTASSVTVDNVFTSSYTNYIVDINYTTSTTNLVNAKLRASGTSASTNYTYQQMQGFTATVSTTAYAAQTSIFVGYYGNTTQEATTIRIMGPQLAQDTQFIIAGGGLGGALVQNIYGQHTTATAYDGLEILTSGGTMTGTYAIYGLAKS